MDQHFRAVTPGPSARPARGLSYRTVARREAGCRRRRRRNRQRRGARRSAWRSCARRRASSLSAATTRPRWRMSRRRMGVSKPFLYYYLKNKEDILFECSRIATEQLHAVLEEVRAGRGTGWERLRLLFRGYARGDVHRFRHLPDPQHRAGLAADASCARGCSPAGGRLNSEVEKLLAAGHCGRLDPQLPSAHDELSRCSAPSTGSAPGTARRARWRRRASRTHSWTSSRAGCCRRGGARLMRVFDWFEYHARARPDVDFLRAAWRRRELRGGRCLDRPLRPGADGARLRLGDRRPGFPATRRRWG